MEADAGLRGPLFIQTPAVTLAMLVHSTPFASAANQLSLTIQSNVLSLLNRSWFPSRQ